MGKPTAGKPAVSWTEYIGPWRRTGELKHLSTLGTESNSDSLSSGERTGTSPNRLYVKAAERCTVGVAGLVRESR